MPEVSDKIYLSQESVVLLDANPKANHWKSVLHLDKIIFFQIEPYFYPAFRHFTNMKMDSDPLPQ